MPRIVMVNTTSHASHGRLMRDLQDAAAAQGYDTTVAFGRGADLDRPMIRIGTRRDVLLHVALTRLLDRHARGSLGATRRFLEAVDAARPDLLHLHNLHGYYLHAETLFDYIRARQLPTLWTHHDCWALTGHCSHFVRAYCTRWETGCHDCPLKHEYPASYGLDASRENWRWKKAAFATAPSLRIITPSQWLSDIIGRSYLQNIPRKIIPNGVDLEQFRPREDVQRIKAVRARFGIAAGQALLLGVAAPFDARKGFDDALEVAGRLGGKARVVLVGLTEEQLRQLPEGVSGIARTDDVDALVDLYNAADCLINPTYEDTYPTVNMEAMACGTPVVGYSTGGAKEQLAVACAVAVPVGNAGILASAAMQMAERKPKLQTYCRTHAENHFDRRRAVETYLGVYETMTGAKINGET